MPDTINGKLNAGLSPLLKSITNANKNVVVKDYIGSLRLILNDFHKSGLGAGRRAALRHMPQADP